MDRSCVRLFLIIVNTVTIVFIVFSYEPCVPYVQLQVLLWCCSHYIHVSYSLSFIGRGVQLLFFLFFPVHGDMFNIYRALSAKTSNLGKLYNMCNCHLLFHGSLKYTAHPLILLNMCRSGSLGGVTKEFVIRKMNGWSKFQIKPVSV